MAVLTNTMLQGTSADTGEESYEIERSLRFYKEDMPQLRGALTTKGNTRTWTKAFWLKQNPLADGAGNVICGVHGSGKEYFMTFEAAGEFRVYLDGADTIKSTARYKDSSSWQHFVLAVDTTQAIATERVKLYVNGEQVTIFSATTWPDQNAETHWNVAQDHYIGSRRVTSYYGSFLLADFHFIDGLQLGAGSFGEFDSKGRWNPKEFALPTPNNNTTWSNTLVNDQGNGFNNSTSAAKLFDGDLTTHISGNGNFTWTAPGDGIKYTTSVQVYFDWGSDSSHYEQAQVNDLGWVNMVSGQWITVHAGSGTLTTLKFRDFRGTGLDTSWFRAVSIDGVVLVDGKTDKTYEETITAGGGGRTWSADITSNGTLQNAANAFDGDMSTRAQTANSGNDKTLTWAPSPPVTFTSKLEVYCDQGDNTPKAEWNGNSVAPGGGAWVTVYTGSGEISSTYPLVIDTKTAGQFPTLKGVRLDNTILTDGTPFSGADFGKNSFHLKLNDTAENKNLGYSQMMNTPTGAQPMYGSGASDSAKSSLVLALPGYDLNDHSATIKGSGSNKTVTASGAVTVADGTAKFYGTCLKFDDDGSNDVLSIANNEDLCDFGTGNFTMEAWIKPTKVSDSMFVMGCSKNGSNPNRRGPMIFVSSGTDNEIRFEYSTGGTHAAYINDGTRGAPQDKWTHIAVVRNGNDCKLYINGIQDGSTLDVSSIATAADNNDDPFTIGHNSDQTWGAFDGYMQDVRVYKGAAKYTANFIPPLRNDFTVTNLAHDTGGTTVANSTGAKPILTTTDSFGTTTGGSVDTTDPAKASIKIALPFQDDTNDVHHTVKGSGSARTVTAVDAKYTTTSKFYGGAADFTDTSDQFSTQVSNSDGHFDVGTGNVTIEWWAYYPSTVASNGYIFRSDTTNGDECYAYAHSNGMVAVKFAGFTWQAWPNDGSGGHADFENGVWNHFCIMRSGSTWTAYMNGVAKRTTTNAVDFNPGDTIGIGNYNNSSTSYYAKCYLQDFRWYNTDKYSGNFTPPAEPTSTEISGLDSLFDTPTDYTDATGVIRGNYCTMNPFDKGSAISLIEGNFTVTTPTSNGNWDTRKTVGTLAMNGGKFYYEQEVVSKNGGYHVGVVQDSPNANTSSLGFLPTGYAYYSENGTKYHATASNAYGNSYGAGDTISVAFDGITGTLWFAKNGTWQNSATKSEIAAGTTTNAAWTAIAKDMRPAFSTYEQSESNYNFGQRAWKYPSIVPDGFTGLSTTNLPDLFSGDELNAPSNYFDLKSVKGTGIDNTDINHWDFGPDLIWSKLWGPSGGGYKWRAWDQIRGATKEINMNDANMWESTQSGGIKQFNSNGFRVGTFNEVNQSEKDYLFVCWDAGTAAATASTSGSINPSAQWVNNTAGFSISKYEGTGANATVGHGLTTPPELIIIKNIDNAQPWIVGSSHVHATAPYAYYMNIHTTLAATTESTVWNDTSPTNTVFSLGATASVNEDNENHIAYCWTSIPGYSAFGSYTGEAYVHTGFQPKAVLIKCINSAQDWWLMDTSRSPSNVIKHVMRLNTDATTNTSVDAIDFLSNGFKIMSSDAAIGDSSNTYIYAAWAEFPSKIARAF